MWNKSPISKLQSVSVCIQPYMFSNKLTSNICSGSKLKHQQEAETDYLNWRLKPLGCIIYLCLAVWLPDHHYRGENLNYLLITLCIIHYVRLINQHNLPNMIHYVSIFIKKRKDLFVCKEIESSIQHQGTMGLKATRGKRLV